MKGVAKSNPPLEKVEPKPLSIPKGKRKLREKSGPNKGLFTGGGPYGFRVFKTTFRIYCCFECCVDRKRFKRSKKPKQISFAPLFQKWIF
jgi:hypothetical protein